MRHDEPITEADFQAYVDGQLGLDRTRSVERHLAAHPVIAAQVMADLANRRALRTALDEPVLAEDSRVRTRALALTKALGQRNRLQRFPLAGALVLVFLGGWGAAQLLPVAAPPPAFVDEAVMSRRTALLRAAMASQLEVAQLDREEVSGALRIVLPELPSDWHLTDAQVFPSDDGPSLGLAFDTPEFGPVTFFAVRTRHASSIAPTAIRREDSVVAYWQQGELAYALTASGGQAELAVLARRLADSLPDTARRS